jgi:putative transposase
MMILTYKYRIKDKSARKTLRQHAYAVNQVWNWCVGHQRDIESRYRAGAPKRKWPSVYDLYHLTSGTSKELGTHSQTVEETCRIFCVSRDQSRRTPRFRASGGSRRSLGWVPFVKQTRKVRGNCVTYLGKVFRFWEGGRPLPESAKGGAFVEDSCGRWYVCFQVEVDSTSAVEGAIGIDLGLKNLATCSDGATIPALRFYRKFEAKLAIAQRSGNKRRVRAIHAKIANARRDQLHKASTQIARANSLIVVGNVNAARLKQTKMAKSISDAGWSAFRNMLRYKASRHGARYEEVDERFTSQTCSCCGVIPASSPKGMGALGIRRWQCDCGAVHDRDVNAAINILNVALGAQRHADGSRGSANVGNRISATKDQLQPPEFVE